MNDAKNNSKDAGRKLLLIGYGNPGRRDDGLGPAFAAAVEGCGWPGVAVESDYQLTVEDAADIAVYETVVFADASLNGSAPFELTEIKAEQVGSLSFSSHSVRPEGVVALSQELFARRGRAYLLSLRGYEFDEFGEGLSAGAERNLAAALEFFPGWIKDLESGTQAS